MNPITLLLVDDQEIVRAGLRSLLENDQEIDIVGEAADGSSAIDMAVQLRPDVVLMDISLPDINGAAATRRIKERAAGINILALTIHEDEAYFFEMLNAGASGYVPKRASPEDLLAAIRTVALGEVFLHPFVAGTLLQDYLRNVDAESIEDMYAARFAELEDRKRRILEEEIPKYVKQMQKTDDPNEIAALKKKIEDARGPGLERIEKQINDTRKNQQNKNWM